MGRRHQDDWGIPEEAARWFCRLHGPDPEHFHSAFETWLAKSDAHRHEFYLVSLIDMQMDALRRQAGELRLGEPENLDRRVVPFRQRGSHVPQFVAAPASLSEPVNSAIRRAPRVAGLLYAATLAVLVFGLLFTYGVIGESTDYGTRVGEQRTVHLEDGTLVRLNTRSRIVVSFTHEMRSVELIDGEALMDVGRDSRPFEVRIGSAVVRDIGTQFSIRRQGDVADIVVHHGQVSVAIAPRVRTGARQWRPLAALHAGETVSVSTNIDAPTPRVRELNTAEITNSMAWTRGYVAFAGERLDEVVADINRYNTRQIQIEDPAIAKLRLGGQFRANDPEGLAGALASMFGLQMVVPVGSDEPIRLVGMAQ